MVHTALNIFRSGIDDINHPHHDILTLTSDYETQTRMIKVNEGRKEEGGGGGKSAEEEVEIGKTYLVRRGEVAWSRALVIQSRLVGACQEFYVHYEKSDRRLDEWVVRDRIRSCHHQEEEGEADGPSARKITRNQKRRSTRSSRGSSTSTGSRLAGLRSTLGTSHPTQRSTASAPSCGCASTASST